MDTQSLIESLQAQVIPINPQDTMADAGRKALLNDFIKMLNHDAGSRSGEDPEEVHDMRVAIRRMRSTLRLLAAYYKPKAIEPYLTEMRKIARALGTVRDLDVMIADLQAYDATLDPDARGQFQALCDAMVQQQVQARKALVRVLDKGSYAHFVDDFSVFVTKPGKGAYAIELDGVQPFQVRHLLPRLVYEHLGAVRAYDDAIPDADAVTLHALRIEFKRLRYVVSVFADVLGSTASDFEGELKAIQDHLGKIADIRAAKDTLKDLAAEFKGQDEVLAAIQGYLEHLDAQQDALRDSFGEVWKHFNTRTVQRQLSNAVATL